jgi:uncharacterized protein YbaR (Trm112 family)
MKPPHPQTGVVDVGRLDGNVLAGPLSEIFRTDMTLAVGRCRNCQVEYPLAETTVEMDDAGVIVICPRCRHTLFTVVRTEERVWVDLQGVAGLGIPLDRA